ncbi:hypothetical protein KC349_g5410 [Hortaea werneckii]|nr:hypothetical protein KC349_g5410 [Hortaea werneckii]
MPNINIHTIKGVRSPEELRKLADVVQQCSLDYFKAPPKDRYQIITQHDPYEIICEDTNLGLKRTDKLVFIQVFQQGRTAEVKQQFYAKLAEHLKAGCGLEGGDLLVTCIENRKEDWSFGNGEAQFLTGAL